MKETGKVINTYTIRNVEKKLIGDVMKANKSATIKRRRLKKRTVIEKENVEVVDVGEGDDDIDLDVAVAIEKR